MHVVLPAVRTLGPQSIQIRIEIRNACVLDLVSEVLNLKYNHAISKLKQILIERFAQIQRDTIKPLEE